MDSSHCALTEGIWDWESSPQAQWNESLVEPPWAYGVVHPEGQVFA